MAGKTLGSTPQRSRAKGGKTLPLSPWQSPPAQFPLVADQLDLWRFRLDLPQPDTHNLKRLLSRDEHARAERLLDPHKSAHFIVARARLRQIVARYLVLAPEMIEFTYGEQGKPRLPGNLAEKLAFNLAHAGVWGVLALSAGCEVGVDLERVDPRIESAKVASHYFTPAEQAGWEQYPPVRRCRGFYRIWTRKEALLKAHGDGFASVPQPVAGDDWMLKSFTLAPGYLGALAVAAPIARVQRWDFGERCALKQSP